MPLEVEQKFPLPDPDSLRQRLVRLGAQFREPIDQVDTCFGHPVRSFAHTDEALRLRQVGQENCITYFPSQGRVNFPRVRLGASGSCFSSPNS